MMCSLINCECNESEKDDLNVILSKLFGRHDIGNRKTAQ